MPLEAIITNQKPNNLPHPLKHIVMKIILHFTVMVHGIQNWINIKGKEGQDAKFTHKT